MISDIDCFDDYPLTTLYSAKKLKYIEHDEKQSIELMEAKPIWEKIKFSDTCLATHMYKHVFLL